MSMEKLRAELYAAAQGVAIRLEYTRRTNARFDVVDEVMQVALSHERALMQEIFRDLQERGIVLPRAKP